jgi:phosphotransferase system enzyme I (PtsI)
LEARPDEIGIGEIENTNSSVAPERRIDGVAVSRGVAIGQAVLFERGTTRFEHLADQLPDIESEVSRFQQAVEESKNEILRLVESPQAGEVEHLKDILNIQLLILTQSSFVANVLDEIRENSLLAEEALENVQIRHVQKQNDSHDPHHREKRVDIEDVCKRLAQSLSGAPRTSDSIYRNAVVVAHELTPTEIVEIGRHSPAGFVTERGGWTSHSSILAREFRIPMVSGLKSVDYLVAGGETVIVDGQDGKIIIDPTDRSLSYFAVAAMESRAETPGAELSNLGAKTADGTRVVIRANADTVSAYLLAKKAGAEGIGLFRSESLIEKPGSIPSEDEQVKFYEEIGLAAGEDGVRVRTFDVGENRLNSRGRSGEINPALGLRSIRLSLKEQKHFRTQIRALLRAAARHRIEIVLPMISGVSEVAAALEIIEDERQKLSEKSLSFEQPRIGAMIEVPSALFTAREIASKVDFLALGTNDLVQYLLAVDRDNDQVSELYQTLNPAVIRALRSLIATAKAVDRPLLICGEMAGSAFYVPLLIGLGARELSMNANSINQIRHLISGITLIDAERLAALTDEALTADEVESILRKFYKEHWQTLFPHGLLDAKHR